MAQVTVDFSGTTVFVAGGTSGINLGIAEGFAAAGARVAVMSRSKEKVDAAVTRLQALGAQATGVAADVRDPDPTSAVLQHAHAAFGDIDVLVSGAAGNFPAAALDMSPGGFRSVVDIDLLGSYHVPRAAYPLLRKPWYGRHQRVGTTGVPSHGTAVTCVRRQSRCRHDDPRARHRMGRRRHPGQLGGPWSHRGHRGHEAPGPDPRGS
jgi:NAD(P)-dependent dehydrogenase (short-subunit alcohol dehydrogenase family)